MQELQSADFKLVNGGGDLAPGEYATIAALSGKTFAETCASVYFAGAATSSIFYLTGASVVGLYTGFKLYHWLLEE